MIKKNKNRKFVPPENHLSKCKIHHPKGEPISHFSSQLYFNINMIFRAFVNNLDLDISGNDFMAVVKFSQESIAHIISTFKNCTGIKPFHANVKIDPNIPSASIGFMAIGGNDRRCTSQELKVENPFQTKKGETLSFEIPVLSLTESATYIIFAIREESTDAEVYIFKPSIFTTTCSIPFVYSGRDKKTIESRDEEENFDETESSEGEYGQDSVKE